MSEVPIYNIHMYQGENKKMNFQVLDSNSQPVPLTGYSALLQVRDRPGGNLLLELSTANGMLTVTEATGVVSMDIPTATSASVSFENGVYDLWVFNSSSEPFPWAYGSWTVTQKVSQWVTP